MFFLPALAGDALLTLLLATGRLRPDAGRRGAWHTLAGLFVAGVAAVAAFVLPNWQDYRFYNWQMSVVRKPAYTAKALVDRVTWFPIVHGFFTRMWVVAAMAVGSGLGLVFRWRRWRLPSACSCGGSCSACRNWCCTTSATSGGSCS